MLVRVGAQLKKESGVADGRGDREGGREEDDVTEIDDDRIVPETHGAWIGSGWW